MVEGAVFRCWWPELLVNCSCFLQGAMALYHIPIELYNPRYPRFQVVLVEFHWAFLPPKVAVLPSLGALLMMSAAHFGHNLLSKGGGRSPQNRRAPNGPQTDPGTPGMGWWGASLKPPGRNKMIEGSLEVKLPTIWTDEKQSRAEAERRGRLEERRSEEKE